jgi:hypothetical protein
LNSKLLTKKKSKLSHHKKKHTSSFKKQDPYDNELIKRNLMNKQIPNEFSETDRDDYNSFEMDIQGLKANECKIDFKENSIDVGWRNNRANYIDGENKLSINLFIDCMCFFNSVDEKSHKCNEKLYYLNTCRHKNNFNNYYDYADEDNDGTFFYKRFLSDKERTNNEIKC